jgi:hypothetical protein
MYLFLKKISLASVLVGGSLVSLMSNAEPTSNPVRITALRPYSSTAVFVYTNNPPGSFCSTSTYSIDLTTSGGKAMYAAALTALATNRPVNLELRSCSDDGINPLQSLYIKP